MIRGLVRLMLIVVVVVAAAFYLFGYWSGGQEGTTTEIGRPPLDTTTAREAGADIGEKAAVAAAQVSKSLEEGSLTAKIKAKMVLDDLVKARGINVTTDGTVVTLAGTVHSPQERARALTLARETDGVTRVVDQLVTR